MDKNKGLKGAGIGKDSLQFVHRNTRGVSLPHTRRVRTPPRPSGRTGGSGADEFSCVMAQVPRRTKTTERTTRAARRWEPRLERRYNNRALSGLHVDGLQVLRTASEPQRLAWRKSILRFEMQGG